MTGGSLLTRRRVIRAMLFAAVVGLIVHRFWVRPRSLPLATYVDGPSPSQAWGVIFLLHGRGGGRGDRMRALVRGLRESGLRPDVSVVLVEGPFATWFGNSWGDDVKDFVESRRRVQALVHSMRGDHGPPDERVVIAGFSQGAAIAADLAADDPTIGALASFSPCWIGLREQLPKRKNLRVLLGHGSQDKVCPVVESRSLARVLQTANVPVEYVEFDGGHEVPPEVLRALVAFASRP
jgi:phospholipase/carboxylesterase